MMFHWKIIALLALCLNISQVQCFRRQLLRFPVDKKGFRSRLLSFRMSTKQISEPNTSSYDKLTYIRSNILTTEMNEDYRFLKQLVRGRKSKSELMKTRQELNIYLQNMEVNKFLSFLSVMLEEFDLTEELVSSSTLCVN